MEFVPPDCPVEPAGYLKTFSKTLTTVKRLNHHLYRSERITTLRKRLSCYTLKIALSDVHRDSFSEVSRMDSSIVIFHHKIELAGASRIRRSLMIRVGRLTGIFYRFASCSTAKLAKFLRDFSESPGPDDFSSKRKGRVRARGLNQSLLHLEAGGKTQF